MLRQQKYAQQQNSSYVKQMGSTNKIKQVMVAMQQKNEQVNRAKN